MTDDLIEFLRARLDEDEQTARLMEEHYPSPWDLADRGWMAHVVADGPDFREVTRLEQWAGQPEGADAPWLGDIIAHIARHDPARVLREVEAKRELLSRYEAMEAGVLVMTGVESILSEYRRVILPQMALPYADHPSYREDWRP